MENLYAPFKSKLMEIIKHTDIEYTFRMEFTGDVKPGQFFEVSIPKYGECPISVSGIGENYIDLTIRKVGKVTGEIFEYKEGNSLFLRGPYGNGFDVNLYKGKEIIVVSGGSGLAPVKGIVDYYHENLDQCETFDLIAGFKTPKDILFKKDLEIWKSNLNVILTVDCNDETYVCNEGLVTEYVDHVEISKLDEVRAIVVGPPMMMKFTVEALLRRGIAESQITVSYERKMCCGVGKCGHCKMDDTYICLEGPVFNYEEAKNLFD